MSEHLSEKKGPFSVFTNEYGKQFLRYEGANGERFSQMMPRPIKFLLERLARWLNKLWAERGADD